MTAERTDRELLELAAKAAGIDHPGGEHSRYNDGRLWDCNGLRWWNPLEDDGDALRLAARWMMDVEIGITHVTATIPLAISKVFATEEFLDGDQRLPMTRRAIVRAAAAMAEGGEHG